MLMENSLQKSLQDYQNLQQKYLDSEKERKNAERKYESIVSKVGNVTRELRDEKHMNKCLRDNQVTFCLRNFVFGGAWYFLPQDYDFYHYLIIL